MMYIAWGPKIMPYYKASTEHELNYQSPFPTLSYVTVVELWEDTAANFNPM